MINEIKQSIATLEQELRNAREQLDEQELKELKKYINSFTNLSPPYYCAKSALRVSTDTVQRIDKIEVMGDSVEVTYTDFKLRKAPEENKIWFYNKDQFRSYLEEFNEDLKLARFCSLVTCISGLVEDCKEITKNYFEEDN